MVKGSEWKRMRGCESGGAVEGAAGCGVYHRSFRFSFGIGRIS